MAVGRNIILALLMAVLASTVAGADPYQLSYSGRLTDATGKPIAGPVDMAVRFFRLAQGGEPINVTAQDFEEVRLASGIFTVRLNLSGTDHDTLFADGLDVWVEVENLTAGQTYPRQRFTAVPYAIRVPVDGDVLKFADDGRLTLSAAPEDGKYLTSVGGKLQWETPTSTATVEAAGFIKLDDLNASAPLMYNNSTGVLSMGRATSVAHGYLHSDDFVTFFNKQNAITATTDLTLNSVVAKGTLRLDDADGSAGVTLKAHNSTTGYTITLPATVGANGQLLSTNASGELQWISPGGGGDMFAATYDGVAGSVVGMVDDAENALNADALGGQAPAYYLNASNLNNGEINDARIPATIARDSELPVIDATSVGAAGAVMDGDYADGKILVGTSTPGTYTQIDNNSTNWDTAYSLRLQWDGGSTGLDPDAGRTSLGLENVQNVNVLNTFSQNDGQHFGTDEIRALDGDGLRLTDDAGNLGLFVRDGGNIGIGTVTPDSALSVYRTNSDVANQQGVLSYMAPGTTVDGTFYTVGILGQTFKNVETGITDSGYAMGVYAKGVATGPGTLTSAYGVAGLAATYTGATGTITNAYGVRADVLNQGSGTGSTIGTGYGVFIGDVQATTQFGLYQDGATDKNYFAGNVGIGTNDPGDRLHVDGKIRTQQICYTDGNNCKDLSVAWPVIGTNIQAHDAGLESIAGLTTSANQMIYATGPDTYATTGLTLAGRNLLDDADPAAQRTTLGLGNVQDINVQNNFTQNDGQYIATDEIRARDADGLKLFDDAGAPGIHIKDGGNVGVGTTDAVSRLQVSETFAYGTATRDTLLIQPTWDGGTTTDPSSYGSLAWGYAGTPYGRIALVGDNPQANDYSHMEFWTKGADNLVERMRITRDGRLGINTTAPYGLLHVRRTDYTNDTVDGIVGNVYQVNSVNYGSFGANSRIGLLGSASRGTVVNLPANPLGSQYTTAGVVGLAAGNSGNGFGIGVFGWGQAVSAATGQNAGGKFKADAQGVLNAGDAFYGVISSASGVENTTGSDSVYGITGQAVGGAGDTTYGGYFSGGGGTTNWGVYSAAGSNYFNGNVGIGVTDPGRLLDVNGFSRFRNTINLGSTDEQGSLSWTANMGNGEGGIVLRAGAAKGIQLQSSNGTQALTIESSGDVGLGVVSPAERLDLGTGYAKGRGFKSDDGSALELISSGTTISQSFIFNTTELRSGGHLLNVKNNGSTKFNITDAGRIGFGTDDPQKAVEIRSTDSGSATFDSANMKGIRIYDPDASGSWKNYGITFETGAGEAAFIGAHRNSDASTKLKFGTNDTERMTIDVNGNVGIGTTGPSTRLHVNDGAARVDLGGTGTSFTLTGTGSNLQFKHDGVGQPVRIFNSGSPIEFTQGDGSTTMMRMDSGNGNIGIGTDNPTAKLQVAGQIVGQSFNAGASSSIDFANGNIQYTSSNDATINLSNMIDGGSYTVVITANAVPVQHDFAHAGGLTFKYQPANGVPIPDTDSVYTMLRVGTVVYVSWITGYN